ncbi:alpha-mannosidase [Niveomyces insectorum RCEF 264]|uniref:Alpha-mannosidase n=1 Tax=Niveomyces insectorum RCEF 264 TaxID=1081102 RepID=A0A167ZUA7_9HYPO|nr:alpha-mannosidase [Niveomyces insectorum RCEF 264]
MGGGERTAHLGGGGSSSYPQLAERPVGQRISNIYRERINQFYSTGQWEKVNLLSLMNEGIASGKPHVKLWKWDVPDLARPPFSEAVKQDYEETSVGAFFGPSWSTHWFRVELTVPAALREKELLELHWDSNSEALIWSEDGEPLQGLTGGGERVEWVLPDSYRDGKAHVVYVEMACNGMFGNAAGGDSIQPPDPNRYFQLAKADIVAVNYAARQLFIDIWIIGDAAREFPTDSWEQHTALNVATRIIDAFERGNPASIVRGREIAAEYLGANVDHSSVFAIKPGKEPVVFGIGHCHIDTCWLWPWAETKRKVARSWTNQCNLMEQFPELNFACSQAQQYKWLKQYYPSVFRRVSAKVASGQFHPIGGSWVEHDTNMPSGESLVRQFVYGQRFFEGHFGARCQTFWLPDTFGYSGQLPQLCRLAGMTRFLTQKLSWNNINKFPHTTFNWVALDGSQVVCHMPPSETYTAEAHFGDVRRSVTQHKSMDQDHTSLLVFGKGDGGGGPTWQHIEKLRRCRGMSDTVSGLLPRVHLGQSVDDFFDRLAPKATSLVTWYGELYFELHRGTYTTQANNKHNNRQAEAVLRDLEYLATIASLRSGGAYRYPKAAIDEMWEATLLCQFHDCLPGSSIEMCYDDSDELYAKVFETAKNVLKDIYEALGISALQLSEVGQKMIQGAAAAVNTIPWPRKELIELSDTECVVAAGTGPLLPLSPLSTFLAQDIERNPPVTVTEVRKGVFMLQNADLLVVVQDGVITSLYDHTNQREAIAPGGKANQYVIFDDKPLYWQAWDVEVFHLDTRKELKTSASYIGERKPHRVSIVTETRISDQSSIRTTISLAAALPGEPSQVEVTADVEWHETMRFLKVEFPVAVRNTEASYETQFGFVRRPTHYNTTWDMAKFEVCCHKYADLSEHGYGVSILNDSKYGFATVGNLMRLSLLRAPKAPDAHADMGSHRIRWAILPHAGGLGATTVRKAYQFNSPLNRFVCPKAEAAFAAAAGRPPVLLTGDTALVLDTVKRAEDDADVRSATADDADGPHLPTPRKTRSIVLRIYDSLGGRARGAVQIDTQTWPVARVFKTNLLEDDLEAVAFHAGAGEDGRGKFFIDLRAFEVATYRLELQD